MATKITLIGKPEMGKTTIKKVVFEGEDPNELIIFPLEATIGIQYSVHEIMNSKVSLIDAPGQSLPIIFEDDQKQILAFGDTNAIIYIFDYPTWISDSQDIIDDVKKIFEIRKKHDFDTKIILFLHKIDLLITKKIGSMLALIRRQINKQLNLREEVPIYFTSLHPNLIYTTYNALLDTISNFSKETSTLKGMIKNLIKEFSKTGIFITDKECNLIIQEMTNDFDPSILYYLYERIYQISTSIEEISTNESLVNLGSKILTMVIHNLNNHESNFNKIFVFSETIDKDDMIKIIEELKKELKQKNN